MAGEKLPTKEVEKRVRKCYELRYESEEPFRHVDWQEYCHKNYGDKSELQYTQYWMKSKELYEEAWKERLSKLLAPAVEKIRYNLEQGDERVTPKAIDQVFRYTGNDVQKVEAEVKSEIKVTFGTSE